MILKASRMMKMMMTSEKMMMNGVLEQKRVCQKGAQGRDYKARGGLAAKTLFSLFLCKSDQDFVPTEVQASFKDGPYFQKTPSPPWRKFYLG